MSSRVARRGRVFAALSLAVTGVAHAQSISELTRSLDAAVALRDSAAKLAGGYRVARARSRVYEDTAVMAGGAILLPTSRAAYVVVRAAAAKEDSTLRARMGAELSLIPPHVAGIRVDTSRWDIQPLMAQLVGGVGGS